MDSCIGGYTRVQNYFFFKITFMRNRRSWAQYHSVEFSYWRNNDQKDIQNYNKLWSAREHGHTGHIFVTSKSTGNMF